MMRWAQDYEDVGMLRLLGDPRSDFTNALGLVLDHPDVLAVLGNPRCKRFSMLVDDCIVKTLNVAEGPDDPAGDNKPGVSMVDKMLEDLNSMKAPDGGAAGAAGAPGAIGASGSQTMLMARQTFPSSFKISRGIPWLSSSSRIRPRPLRSATCCSIARPRYSHVLLAEGFPGVGLAVALPLSLLLICAAFRLRHVIWTTTVGPLLAV
eukprot:gnl/TRDRNA2_/TRDRNA2_128678_c0_seq1.p1 gnl/TRDRNA2_/TRDRNA2_128678_c0~~gnl/TRDRNA2_/TRDRNA2_128678_c0_seq1.p1  ORF type:complete len:207 (-),score=16.52 gnl/TRDRNA2_/TRDRNA2_128678_c0_seq1:207-827(-)